MAEDVPGQTDEGTQTADGGNVATLNALHMDGKGQEGLSDATEHDLPDSSEAEGDDVVGFANVQSASRTTFEQIVGGGLKEGPATPTGDNIQTEVAPASNPNSQVQVNLENIHPQQTAQVVTEATDAAPTPTLTTPLPQPEVPTADPRTQVQAGATEISAPEAPTQTGQTGQTGQTSAVAAPAAAPTPPPPDAVLVQEAKTAQTPKLVLGIANGVEDMNGPVGNDQKMKLDIHPTLQDSDGGSEHLTVTIKGVPSGFSFSDASGSALGTLNGDGSWTFSWSTTDQPDLYLVRPLNYSGDLTFEVTATATESSNGSSASTTLTLPVHVEAVADAPRLSVTDVAGMENTSISIGNAISTQLVDTDGSESLVVYIVPKPGSTWGGSDVPAGTTLNHGTLLTSNLVLENGTVIPAGSWAVNPADLADLKVNLAANNSNDFTFQVYSATTESQNGDVAVSGPLDLKVDVGVVAPSVSGSGSGNEDTWISLDLSANVNAADGSETLTVYLENLPAGAELRYADSHTLLVPDANGRYVVTHDLSNLEVHWTTANLDTDISFKLRAVVQDYDALNTGDTPDRNTAITNTVAPDTSQTVSDVTVVVKAVADAPTLTASAVGVEDRYAAISISSALTDTDDSESLTVYVQAGTDAPAGMVIKVYNPTTGELTTATLVTADITLADGTVIKAGSYALTAAQAAQNVRVYGLDAQSDADFHLTVNAVSTEGASAAQTAVRDAVTTVDVAVTVYGDADTPTVSVIDGRQVINEDATYNLQSAVGSTNGADSTDHSQTIISYQIKPVETGSRLFVSGVEQSLSSDGTWTVSASDLSTGKVTVAGPADWGSLNTSLDKHFDIRSLTQEADHAADTSGLTDGLTRATTAYSDWDTLTLGINPVADTPTNTSNATAVGVEDKYATVHLGGASTDTDGSESMTYYLQPGVNAPAGMVVKYYDSTSGQWVEATKTTADLTLSDGTVIKAGSYLLTPGEITQNVRVYGLDSQSDADFHLTATAVATDGTSTAGNSVDVTVTVYGDADTPTVAVIDGRQVINEDALYNLKDAVSATNGADSTDHSQSIISYDIKPEETSHSTLYLKVNGTWVAQTLPPSGYWTVSAADVAAGNVAVAGTTNWASWSSDIYFDIRSTTQESDYAADTSGLTDGLSRTATATSAWDVLDLGVNPVADAPSQPIVKAVGVEDKYAVLNISTDLVDTDGSEQLTVYVSGLTGDQTLNHGTRLTSAITLANGTVIPAGSYQLTASDLSDLRIEHLAADSDADFAVTVTSVATERAADGTFTSSTNIAVSSVTQTVTIFGDADTPTVAVTDATQTILEDESFNLNTLVGGSPAVTSALTDLTNESLLQYRIHPQESGSRLFISGAAQTLSSDGYWYVSVADVAAGKVTVGGAANWSSLTSNLHFDIQIQTRESDYNASTSSLSGTGLSRSATAWSSVDTLTLAVTPVADGTTIGASNTGNEDTAIAITPTITLIDTDGSEHLSGDVYFTSTDPDMISGTIRVGGVVITPELQADGSYRWTIPASAVVAVNGSTSVFTLSGVTFTPSANNAQDMTYSIQTLTTDTTGAFTHTTVANDAVIHVTAVADAPVVAVAAADSAGVVHLTEDTALNLGLSANLTDVLNSTVGSGYNPDPEHFSAVSLGNIPSGWTLWYTHNGTTTQISVSNAGVADLTNLTLSDVYLKPPSNANLTTASSTSFHFSATSAESENSSTATSSVDFKVTIDAVADTPTLQVVNVRVNEDTRAALSITSAVTDSDGSESISDIFISGAPAGTTFWNAATGGTQIGTLGKLVNGAFVADSTGTVWRFSASEASSLYVLPKPDSNVDFDLSVVARSTESSNGSHADSVAQTLHVDVKGISDGAQIPASHLAADGVTLTATATEDSLIDPGFGSYSPKDADGSETLSVVIKDIPDGVTLSMAGNNAKYAKYLGLDSDNHAMWSIDPNHLGDVRFSTAANYSGTFTVKLDLITTENDGNSVVSSRNLDVTVTPVADAPSVSISGSSAEDGWGSTGIPVVFNAAVTDTTVESTAGAGVEHISHVSVTFDLSSLGLPPNTPLTLVINGVDHTITSGVAIDITGSQGTTMYVKGLPDDWSTDIPVTVSATTTEVDASTGAAVNSATTTNSGSIAITAVADQPASFTLTSGATAQAGETIDLGAQVVLGDTDGSEKVAYYIVTGVPNGVTLAHGLNSGDGSWIVDAKYALEVTSQYTGTATLTVTAVIQDTDPDTYAISTAYASQSLPITFTGTAGGWPTTTTPVGSPTITGSVNGSEDTAFNLGGLTVTAGSGSTANAVVISGVDHGTVSGGYYIPGKGYVVASDALGSVVITPTGDYAGTVSATIRTVAVASDGTTAESTSTSTVVANLTPVTDGANVSVTSSGSSGLEDSGAIPLTITLTQRDADHSEVLVGSSVTVKVPTGAVLEIDGTVVTAGTNGVSVDANGNYVISTVLLHASGSYATGSLTYTGLSVVPPANYDTAHDGALSVTVFVTGQDGTAIEVPPSSGSYGLNITAVADTPVITAHNVSGTEDSATTLDVSIAVPDVIGAGGSYASEYLSVIISGVPTDGVIAGALKNSDGTWTVKDANITLVNGVATLSGVTYLGPQDASGSQTLTVTAYTMETSNHAVASDSASFTVSLAGVADTPTISPVAVNNGLEDTPLQLNLGAQLLDSSETLSVTITGVPTGATLVDASGHLAGTTDGNGTWVIAGDKLSQLYFLGATNESGTWTMTTWATSVDGTSSANSNVKTFSVTLSGVADTPTLTLTDQTVAGDGYLASGNEETSIAVGISAALTDPVGETLEVMISGAPAGSVFVNGGTTITQAADGYWHIPPSLLTSNLKITPPTDYNGDISLSVMAHSTENATDAYSTAQTLLVHVAAVNDADIITLHGASGQSEVGAITNPIYVIPTGTANTIDITDIKDGVTDPTVAKMDISIATGAQTGDGISMVGLEPRLDNSGNLVVDFEGSTFTLNYNATTHTLTLSGDANAATYSDLAKQLILTNSSGELIAGVRTLDITVYDNQGLASNTVETTATIGDTTTHTGVTLSGNTLGTVQWGSDGAASLMGSSGNDVLVVSGADAVHSVNGGAGTDLLYMQTSHHTQGDWVYAMDSTTHDVVATSTTGETGFVVHLTQGSVTVDNALHQLVFDENASGTITFNDSATHQIAFSQIEKLVS